MSEANSIKVKHNQIKKAVLTGLLVKLIPFFKFDFLCGRRLRAPAFAGGQPPKPQPSLIMFALSDTVC